MLRPSYYLACPIYLSPRHPQRIEVAQRETWPRDIMPLLASLVSQNRHLDACRLEEHGMVGQKCPEQCSWQVFLLPQSLPTCLLQSGACHSLILMHEVPVVVS